MRKSKFSEHQIMAILKAVEAGRTVRDVCREHEISDATYYQWKSKYGGMQASDIKRLRELEDENRRLEQMSAQGRATMTKLPPEMRRSYERLELWGGVECTVNRVRDAYHDQLKRSGHDCRLEDIDLFAELGIKVIRYPLLWERIAPLDLTTANWSWADERMSRLRELGLKPIVGLVHHGSGPRYTDLLDPEFPEKLATFAAAVAQRYPWIEDYTPVNEPLTTARFSGLYGFWYPHGRSDNIFARAFLNECRAIAESMKAIRKYQPHARLIQTEDLGKT